MKHGLKQEIRRGLSILMAASMVAGSALPVMAEEVVEEAVEVEVVSEEVADEADDVVVDVIEDEDVLEEVVNTEEAVFEEAAEGLGDDLGFDENTPCSNEIFSGQYADILGYEWYKNDAGSVKGANVYYKCNTCGETHLEVVPFSGSSSMKFKTAIKIKQTGNCVTRQDAIYTCILDVYDGNCTETSCYAKDDISVSFASEHVVNSNGFVVTTEPTCDTEGIKTAKCQNCGQIFTEKIDCLKHTYRLNENSIKHSADYKTWTVDVECWKSNKMLHKVTLDISKFVREEYSAFVKPTCGTEGSAEYVIYATKTQLESLLHAQVAEKYIASFAVTNDVLSKSVYVKYDALKHDITKVSYAWTLNGENTPSVEVTYKCKNCTGGTVNSNDVLVEKVASKSQAPKCEPLTNGWNYYHAIATIDGVKYDSTTNGTDCQVTLVATSNSHSYNADKYARKTTDAVVKGTVEPTCTRNSSPDWEFECAYCGKHEKKTIYAYGHSFEIKSGYAVAPTCNDEGWYNAQCTRCKKETSNSAFRDELKTGTDNLVAYTEAALQKLGLMTKNGQAHKYEVVKSKTSWAKNYSSASITVECNCGDSAHNGGTDWASVTKVVTPVEVIDVPATGKTDGKKHYVATVKFTDNLKKDWVFEVASDSVVIPATGEPETATVSIAPKTVAYTGNRQYVKATTNSDVTPVVSYYKDAACTQKYSGAPYTAGTYYVKATVAKSKDYTAAESEVVKLVIEKADPTVTVKASKTSVKNTKKNTVNITVAQKNLGGQQGKVTYTAPSKKISVNSKGVVTIKKGTKKGTYKVIVNVKATTNYNAFTKTIKITVK